jgi:hypothetical protein
VLNERIKKREAERDRMNERRRVKNRRLRKRRKFPGWERAKEAPGVAGRNVKSSDDEKIE